MSLNWHNLLLRQLKRSGFPDPESIPEQCNTLLERVSNSYKDADEARELTNQSIKISSQEMKELYNKLEAYNEELENQVLRRTKELEKAHQLFRTLSELAPIGIYKSDKSKNLVYMNQSFREIFEQKKDSLIGSRWKKFLHVDDAEGVINLGTSSSQLDSNSQIEFRIITKTGENKWLKMNSTPLFNEKHQVAGFVGTLEDVTRQKYYEKGLLQAKEAAEKATLAKSRFLATMSHELRTPLNSILGFAQLMQRDPDSSPKQLENLDRINRGGSHLLGLINDVLEISKIESGKTELATRPCNLYRLLRDLNDIFYNQALEKGLKFFIKRSRAVPKNIITDERKLRQILINLISNAIKFTDHGFVKLETYVTNNSDSNLHPNKTVQIHFNIVDTGKGIARNEKEKLFKVFSQTESGEKLQEGIGLGLNISQEFAEMLGRGIRVESKPNKGSTFSFDITVELADKDLSQSFSAIGSVVGIEPGQASFRVLIADDNVENREILAELIQSIGFPVRNATNGSEAIELFKTWKPTLIFMDLRMPIMDGFEATKKIRVLAKERSPVIIALTAGAFKQVEESNDYEDFDDVIYKPFHEDIIFSTISKHLKVKYIYQKNSPRLNCSSSQLSVEVSMEQLAQLPLSWQEKLYAQALAGETEEGRNLIAQISDKYPNLAESLNHLIEQYRFDKLVNLLDKSIGNKN